MNRKIALTGIIVSLGVVLGRVAGYVREILIAFHFGVSKDADNVVLILTTPDLINNILSVSVLSNAFFPVLNKDKNLSEVVEETISINILFYVLFLLISPFIFSGWLLFCMNIAMSSVLFNGFTFSQATYLAFLKKFKLQSLSTFVYNLGIVSMIAFFPKDIYIAFGVIFAAVLRMIYVSYISRKSRIRFKIKFSNIIKNLRVSKRLWLAIIANGLVFINPIIDKFFLNYFPAGSVSSYSYAEKIYLLPVATIIAIYPDIVYAYIIDNIREGINSLKLITGSILFTILVSGLCSLIFYFFSVETVSIIYYLSKIDISSIERISPILQYFSLAILVAGLNSLLIKLLFASGNDKYVLNASLFGFFFNICANTYILFYAKQAKYMALTTSLTAIVISLCLLFKVIGNIGYFNGINDNRE